MERSLAKSPSRNTPYTLTDRTPLRAEIEQIRRQGWATAPNQSIIGLNALAAPIFDALGTFVGAIAIVDSIQFIPEDPSAKQIRQTVEAGKRISANHRLSRDHALTTRMARDVEEPRSLPRRHIDELRPERDPLSGRSRW